MNNKVNFQFDKFFLHQALDYLDYCVNDTRLYLLYDIALSTLNKLPYLLQYPAINKAFELLNTNKLDMQFISVEGVNIFVCNIYRTNGELLLL